MAPTPRPEPSTERSLRRFDHGDRAAVMSGSGSDLQPDPTATDQNDAGLPGERLPQPVEVFDSTQIEHAVVVSVRDAARDRSVASSSLS